MLWNLQVRTVALGNTSESIDQSLERWMSHFSGDGYNTDLQLCNGMRTLGLCTYTQ
jgi:hypothetical protein